MKNYFETQRVNWRNFSPKNIIFKSNRLVKKLLPSENVLSWTSKSHRNQEMCKKTGCKAVQTNQYNGQPFTYYTKENYKGVMVQLRDLKSDYPCANIDFVDYTDRQDSVGNNIANLDLLMYINSFHCPWQYVRCPQTNNWTRQQNGNIAPVDEGYRISVGGQGDSNPMLFEDFQEILEISNSIKNFLVDCIVPAKNGEYDYSELMVA